MDGFERPLGILEEVWRHPTVDNARKLSQELNDKKSLNFINSGRESVVLVTILQLVPRVDARNRNEIIVHLIETISKILESTHVHSLMSLKTILVILLKEIYDEKTNVVKPGLSEELKLAIVRCVEVAMRRSTYEVVEQFYTKENLILIARMLSVCVELIEKENYRQLRLAAIRCIMSLKYVHDGADADDVVLRTQIAEIIFILLPKVMSTLVYVAVGDDTQGVPVIALAITALGRIFRLIFEDDSEEQMISMAEKTRLTVMNALKKKQPNNSSNSDILKLTLKSATVDDKLQQVDAKQRTSEWLSAASHKCLPHIEKLQKLVGTKHGDVRNELFSFCCQLLSHCQQNLAVCVPTLLRIYLGLTDERHRIVLDENAMEIVENLFVELLMKLPRIYHTGDEDDQLACTAELAGYVTALKGSNRLRITLANANILRNLMAALLSAIELDLTSKLYEEDHAIYEINVEAVEAIASLRNNSPWKSYRNVRSELVVATIEKICRELGDAPTANTFVIDFLLKLLHGNAPNCNEALVLLQFVIRASSKCQSDCALIAEELLAEERWTLSMKVSEPEHRDASTKSQWFEDRTEGLYESAISMRITDIGQAVDERIDERITLNDVKFNILHTCLIAETLGQCALKLNAEFQPFLLRSLQCLLEKSASKYYVIQMAAILALNNITKSCGLDSVADLITANGDYITFSINSAMKLADRCPTALNILKVVLHYCSLESMPHLENIISTVLLECARANQYKNNLSFIELFRMVLTAIRKTLHDVPAQTPCDVSLEENSKRNWVQMLYDIELDDDDEMKDATDEVADDAIDEDIDVDNEVALKDAKPLLIEQTEKIMNRCVRHLASTNREEKIATIETLCIGLDILSRYEDTLLPMVHLIWEPFKQQCMRDKSPVTLRRCVCLLSKLAEYAREFIYKQFVSEILPFILNVLADLSRNEFEGFSYEQSQHFKLLQELLATLCDVLIHIDIQERALNRVLDRSVWLLDRKQPTQLQQMGVQLFSKLFAFDRPTIYVKLIKFENDASDRYRMNCRQIVGAAGN